jgi:IrrE N-terminal-like domain
MSSRSESPGQLSLFERERLVAPVGTSDKAVVERLASRLIEEADAEPPIDVRVIASLRGISRIEARAQEWAGLLIPTEGQLHVRVRDTDGRRRQRFTIGHEAVHTFMPGFEDVVQHRCEPHQRGDRTETLCDFGAAELLMPARTFQRDLLAAGFGLDAVEDLAESYDTSIEASGIRTVDYWREPAALLVFKVQLKPSERSATEAEPKLRLAWSTTSGAWPYLLRHKSVDENSPFHAALMGESIATRSSLRGLASQELEVELEARAYGPGRVVALARPVAATVAA